RPSLAVQAVRALCEIGCADERVRTALADLWLSPGASPGVLAEAAIAQCRLMIGPGGLTKVLTSSLAGNQDAGVRKSAAEALAWCRKNEPDVVPVLLRAALNDKNEDVRRAAEAGLVKLGLCRERAIGICMK